jgi:mRNA-degrading endonuclease toxin of MazEF toxin-antitoxin module
MPGKDDPRPVIVVSRNTGRATCIVVPITSTPPPTAHPDVVPIAGMECEGQLHGFVRCDQTALLIKDDLSPNETYHCSLSANDLEAIAAGLRAAFQI